MKCKGIKDPKKCLACKYDDCIVDEFGNLPKYAEDKIIANRQACAEYYQKHREEILEKRHTPEAEARRYQNTLRWRAENPEKVKKQRKKYYKKHREEQRKKQNEAYAQNREERCAKMREYYWRKKSEARCGETG